MVKKDIHPEQFETVIELNDGSSFKTLISRKESNGVLKLDADPTNHPAWKEDSAGMASLMKNEQVDKFKKKFGNFDFFGGKADKAEDDKKDSN